MEFENMEEITAALCQIDITDEPGSEKNEFYNFERHNFKCIPQQKFPPAPKEYIDFELYIQNNCKNKIQLLNRETFHKIKRPIVIFFNHFREKCAYLTKWLDAMYQLALQYGDRIDFIAADMIDIDVIFPGTDPINSFCRLVRPERESPNTYAIDEDKRIHQHFDAYQTVDNLLELCENLLSGNLFPSQPLPENNETNLVKICVHHNFKELVLNSTKNIFLIISLDTCQFNEPNYDKVALALKDYNIDIVYMEAEKNYVPFKYFANCYPTILFIPSNDKDNFIYYENFREEKLVIKFLKNCLEKPEYLQTIQQQQWSRKCTAVKVSPDFLIDFNDLQQFLNENYRKSIQVLNRTLLKKTKSLILIAFMDFQGKCSCHHVEWLNKLYRVFETCYSFDIFVADFKDIDVINTRWQPEDMIKSAQGKPKIYAFDRLKNTYEFGHFDSISSLFYFTDSIINGDFYYSQVYERGMENKLVKVWTANYFNIFLKRLKKHIFITFYSSDDENTEKLSNLLELVAKDVRPLDVEVAKFDVKFNYVSLEYAQEYYPVHYFIPKNNKRDSRLYVDNNLSKDKMLEFIKINV